MKTANKNIIKVIGVGGAGCNAVNYLQKTQVDSVQLIACNTDAESLSKSPIDNKLLIGGGALKDHAGAGLPSDARNAALEMQAEIKSILVDGTQIVFVIAGMGGSAGTGVAPIIAHEAKKLGILTIGIVLMPFSFEGNPKAKIADEGLQQMREYTDSLLTLSNDKLKVQCGDLPVQECFKKLDELIGHNIRAIADLIAITDELNVDVQDITEVLSNAGTAVIGSATKSGECRALLAAKGATNFPLQSKNDIRGTRKAIVSIMSGDRSELEMEEVTQIVEHIQDQAGLETEIIFGHGIDEALNESIRVTVIAAGFSDN